MALAEAVMRYDMIIVGAGPIGLALAASLGRAGLDIALVERQTRENLASPAFDGREIALTHESRRILSTLGAWQRLPAEDIHPLRCARVLNGASSRGLLLEPSNTHDRLGHLVPNFRIREALHELVSGMPNVTLHAGRGVVAAHLDTYGHAEVRLADGEALRGRLLVAADSRLSPLRQWFGIRTDITRLPKSMLVFRVEHDAPHDQIATEWFDHGRTIATLPLAAGLSSIVLTLPHREAERFAHAPDAELAHGIRRILGRHMGVSRIASTRHIYPLVMTYAHRFAERHFALAGDAAVGMHPVTAHGFNLGLNGQAVLAEGVAEALQSGESAGLAGALQRYAVLHRQRTRPIYLATNALVSLFTAESPAARLTRAAVLAAASRMPGARGLISSMLS